MTDDFAQWWVLKRYAADKASPPEYASVADYIYAIARITCSIHRTKRTA
jgi:hypothetical protein